MFPGVHSAALEEAVAGWWHGGRGRFELVPSQPGAPTPATLVVVFSSLGNGVIRPEFRGSLRPTAGRPAGYDALYVLDPARSWYSQDPGCTWRGFEHFERELRAAIADGGYQHVLMMGDSMGGSGALLFS